MEQKELLLRNEEINSDVELLTYTKQVLENLNTTDYKSNTLAKNTQIYLFNNPVLLQKLGPAFSDGSVLFLHHDKFKQIMGSDNEERTESKIKETCDSALSQMNQLIADTRKSDSKNSSVAIIDADRLMTIFKACCPDSAALLSIGLTSEKTRDFQKLEEDILNATSLESKTHNFSSSLEQSAGQQLLNWIKEEKFSKIKNKFFKESSYSSYSKTSANIVNQVACAFFTDHLKSIFVDHFGSEKFLINDKIDPKNLGVIALGQKIGRYVSDSGVYETGGLNDFIQTFKENLRHTKFNASGSFYSLNQNRKIDGPKKSGFVNIDFDIKKTLLDGISNVESVNLNTVEQFISEFTGASDLSLNTILPNYQKKRSPK